MAVKPETKERPPWWTEPPHGRTKIELRKRKPILCVNDQNENPVLSSNPPAYLCWDGHTARYYMVPSDPKIYLGSDLKRAIWRFRAIVNGDDETIEYEQDSFWGVESIELTKGLTGGNVVISNPHKSKRKFPESEAYKFVAGKILSDPKQAARKLQIPEIERLHSLPKPEPSPKLTDCLQLFHDKKRKVGTEENDKVKSSWLLFTKSVAPAVTLADVTEQRFQKWIDACWLPYEDGGSAVTLHHVIERVNRVIKFVKEKKGLDPQSCERLMGWIKRQELPAKTGSQPSPLSVTEWNSLYDASKGTQWEPMLVTMLNCCYYGCDIRRLPVAALDLKARTLNFDRQKKGTPRVAVLWKRTADSLKKWINANPGTETVFVSMYRTPYADEGLRTAFRLFREKNELPATITLNRVRDSAYTAAIAAGSIPARVLAGHSIQGESDAYVRRNPELTRPAVEAIEKFYFAGKK